MCVVEGGGGDGPFWTSRARTRRPTKLRARSSASTLSMMALRASSLRARSQRILSALSVGGLLASYR